MEIGNFDTDKDRVLNSQDAVPYDKKITWPRSPEPSYVMLQLPDVNMECFDRVLLNNQGWIAFVKSSPSAGTTFVRWKPGQTVTEELVVPEASYLRGITGEGPGSVPIVVYLKDEWLLHRWGIGTSDTLIDPPQFDPPPGYDTALSNYSIFHCDVDVVCSGGAMYSTSCLGEAEEVYGDPESWPYFTYSTHAIREGLVWSGDWQPWCHSERWSGGYLSYSGGDPVPELLDFVIPPLFAERDLFGGAFGSSAYRGASRGGKVFGVRTHFIANDPEDEPDDEHIDTVYWGNAAGSSPADFSPDLAWDIVSQNDWEPEPAMVPEPAPSTPPHKPGSLSISASGTLAFRTGTNTWQSTPCRHWTPGSINFPVQISGPQTSDTRGFYVNNRGEVLAETEFGESAIWRNGKVKALSALVGGSPALIADSINDEGWISARRVEWVSGEFWPRFHPVVLAPVSIALDVNRDNLIEQGETASQQHPLRFWINSDSDTGATDEEEEGVAFDSNDDIITNKRDLEDFQLFKIDIPPVLYDKVLSGQVQIGLKLKEYPGITPGPGVSPAVKVYKAAYSIDEPMDYLWHYMNSGMQANSLYWTSIATLFGGHATRWLPANTLRDGIADGQHPYFLFEGYSKGKGELSLVIQNDGVEFENPGIWLNLVDVQEMFEFARGTPSSYPNPPDYPGAQPPRPATGFEPFSWPARPQLQAAPDEANEAIIMVHGWNMTDPDKRTFSESFFKRLWWKGYKGRFCSFSWPTYNGDDDVHVAGIGNFPDHYNASEYVAFKYGPALKAYVDSIQKSSKNVAAHSMGNIVMASALRSGLKVNSYVALEPAIPAGCYDDSAAGNNYADFLNAEQFNSTPNQANPDLGYRNVMSGISGNFHNFFNPADFALKTGVTIKLFLSVQTNWEANQIDHKPNRFKNYFHFPDMLGGAKNQIYYDSEHYRFVTDHHEVMSFIARPRSEALGVRITPGFADFNMAGIPHYPWGTLRTEHSGQYQRPIQKTHSFFNTLLDRMDVRFTYLNDPSL